MQIIDVSLGDIKQKDLVFDFLEKNVDMLIDEYNFKLSSKEYVKIMYYIFRDLVGLNRIESLLSDPYIEDIGCDGMGVPIYVVHQRFGSMRTNIVYNDIRELREFVTKLAERCDRYISYAEPLLDGSLTDGTRVQASLASDVTTKGPTFSMRKFREIPFTPVDVVRLNTASSEMLAYVWFIVENGVHNKVLDNVAQARPVGVDQGSGGNNRPQTKHYVLAHGETVEFFHDLFRDCAGVNILHFEINHSALQAAEVQ